MSEKLDSISFWNIIFFGELIVGCAAMSLLGICLELPLSYIIIPIGVIILILAIAIICQTGPKSKSPV